MAAKIIRKEGKKLIIEITVDLEDSMLDSEEAIQAVVNEAGTLATEEALKQFDTQGEAIEIEGKPWRSKGQEQKFYQTPAIQSISIHDKETTAYDGIKIYSSGCFC
jgi:hypothetical protein